MADVFLSYARSDQDIAGELCALLESEGWDVWYDQDLRAGERWEQHLLGVLEASKVVVVLWSAHALKSPWVRREAQLALDAGKLVPVLLDESMPGEPFDAIEAATLRGWSGAREHPELHVLFDGMQALAKPSRLDTVRPGYDDAFLGTTIGLPDIPGPGDEFPYLHFSVVMNPGRRLAWYAAYNIRERDPEVARQGQFMPDPTLAPAFQPGDDLYRGSGFDRGHLAAPSTVTWGGMPYSRIAMRQSFFLPNTTPQTRAFNASSWRLLEERERKIAAGRAKAVGFSGPVFAADDVALGGVQVRGRLRAHGTFRVPREYFKVVAALGDDGELEAVAHRLENASARTSPQALGLDELEALTGLRFPAVLHDARRLDAF